MPFRQGLRRVLIAATVALLFSTRALAAFHLWEFNEIYTNADGTIQFIEFTTDTGGENFLEGIRLISNSTTGYTLPCCDLVGDTANQKFLVATSGFAALSGITPDYVMPDNFIAVTGGDTLTLRSVSLLADTISFESGILPTNGVGSLSFSMIGTPTPSTNNSPTNFAGQTGSVLVPTNVFVDFSAGSGGFGTEVLPFGTLQEALDVVEPPATINLEPGPYNETFSGPGISDTDTLTLINNAPGEGSVIIGAPLARTENRSGFRSKPIASTSTRSGAP